MMNAKEREVALREMRAASHAFYFKAVQIGNHPFIEFAGLMNEYIKVCEDAHAAGIDFSECNTHAGQALPMAPHQVDYVNEKLECIYVGRVMMGRDPKDALRQVVKEARSHGIYDVPELYDVAKKINHEHGMPWTDPRTGITHDPPKAR